MFRIRFFARLLIWSAALTACQLSWAKDIYLRKWPAGTPTPALQLRDLDGREWHNRDLHGKVVVLNFWATWCGPCVEELRQLNDLAAAEFAGGKPLILGVNFKESASSIQRFAQEHTFHYPVLLDQTGNVFKRWTNGVLPTTVLIDRQGRARWRIVGALDPANANLKQALDKMLAEPLPAARGKGRAAAK